MRRRRIALLTLLLLAGFAAVLIVLTWREVQQARLDHALIVALKTHATGRMATLLQRGADPNARDGPERSITWHVLLDRLLHRSAISTKGDTALLIAVRDRSHEEVESLLQAGANSNGCVPFHLVYPCLRSKS